MKKLLSICALVLSGEVGLAAADVVALLPAPYHWDQNGLYNRGILEEYGSQFGTNPCAGCVAVSGASIMEYFGLPKAFKAGTVIGDNPRELRPEALDWDRLGPGLQPLDARGRRTAQTALYNLGLLVGMGYRDFPTASTANPSSLAKALVDEHVGYASAYFVELGGRTDEAAYNAAIWASLRCGSPVGLNIQGSSAHAVPAFGYRIAEDGTHETQVVIGMLQTAPFWRTLPDVGYNGYNAVPSVITGIVPTRPEGVKPGHYAVPVLGTVKTEADVPVPLATVTLKKADGTLLGTTVTDLKGRFGIWGWLGYNMTLSCGGVSKALPAKPNNLVSRTAAGVPTMKLSDLMAAVQDYTVTLRADLPTPTIHTDLKAAAATAGNDILCLHSDDPEYSAWFLKKADTCTLFFADPRLDSGPADLTVHPEAPFLVFSSDGTLKGFSEGAPTSVTFDNLIKTPSSYPKTITLTGDSAQIRASDHGKYLTVDTDVTATVTADVRVDTLTVNEPLTLVGEHSFTWVTLKQYAPITFDGPNLRYVPPKVGDGSDSAFGRDFTVRNGAELLFVNGDVSGYGRTTGTLTIGPGGILCVAKRDTLRRPLILAGGTIQLGDKDGKFGSLDLFSTPVSITEDSSVEALSGAVNPRLTIRQAASAQTTTFTFKDDARLDVRVPVSAAEGASLLITGTGTAAFHDTVSAPTAVDAGVRLEGGVFTGVLSLLSGARLTPDAPITVSGTFSAGGEIIVEGERSGLLVKGVTALPEGVTFKVPEGFAVEPTADGLRLVAAFTTEPVIYVNGAVVDTLPATPKRNVLVFTTNNRKEFGMWEAYATYRSSQEGGGWNVKIASTGNVPTNDTYADYIQASGCDYIVIGGSVADIPPATMGDDGAPSDAAYVTEGQSIGRLPIREAIRIGTSATGETGEDGALYDEAAQIAGFVEKLRRAEAAFADGQLTLLGSGYGLLTPPKLPNRGDYATAGEYNAAIKDYYDNVLPGFQASTYPYMNKEDYSAYDGLPGNTDSSWNFSSKEGSYTLFALRDRYRSFRQKADNAFPKERLFIYDSTAPATISVESVRQRDGTLLWAEGQPSRIALGPILTTGATVSQTNVGAMSGLHELILSPIGQSGDFSQANAPCVGEMLVLNPQGGALAAILPAGSYTPEVNAEGIPSGKLHEACGAIAKALIADPSLTVGEAFSRAAGETSLTVLGDPTVRIAPFAEAEGPELTFPEAEGAAPTLSEQATAAIRAAIEEAGLTGPVEVVARSADGVQKRPTAELGDALACFEGLKPTVKEGRVVVAYDFGISDIRWDGTEVVATLAVRGGDGQAPTFAEGNVYKVVQESAARRGPLEARAEGAGGGTVTVRFSPPAEETFLFHFSVSPGQ